MLSWQGEGGVEETIHPFGFCYNPRLGKWRTTGLLIRTLMLIDLIELVVHIRDLRHDGPREMSVLTDGVRREALRHRRL